MNNTGKKILILGTVIAIAIAGILVFYPTIVAPPVDVPVNNLHKSSLEANINGFSDVENTTFNDSIYKVVVDKLVMYKSEGFMSEEEIDYQTKALVQKYLPIFIKLSNSKFRASSWQESDHTAMLNRITHLRTLKVDYGETNAVTGTYESELRRIEQIISNYREAKSVANYSTFHSVSDANTKIQSAERYKTMEPLSYCTELTNRLANVKSNIGNSHYQQVESKVNEMANYRYMEESSFNSLVSVVNSKITEYDTNRSWYGYNAKTTETLKEKAAEYYRTAREFYNRKEINISTSYQWTNMTSPNSSYRAYQSTSNYNIHNSNATMTFTIKGYETFTFYIRSNGEPSYDYVLVGLDSMPTTSSSYANTHGNAQSGTTFSYYSPVTLRNLVKSNTYTIYVVYHKDGSNNEGTDKGYVLIPYVNN